MNAPDTNNLATSNLLNPKTWRKRSVNMITQEMCPMEISTHKNSVKCIYLLFVWLAVIGFRQNYFYILPNFGDFGAKMSFFHYIINQKRNNFIKHCSPIVGNSKDQVIDMHGDFCLVFTASPKWRVELWAKISHYRNRCLGHFNSYSL